MISPTPKTAQIMAMILSLRFFLRVNSNAQVFASSWTGSPGGSSSSSSSDSRSPSDSSNHPTTSSGQSSSSSGQASSSQQTRSPPESQEDEGTPATRSDHPFLDHMNSCVLRRTKITELPSPSIFILLSFCLWSFTSFLFTLSSGQWHSGHYNHFEKCKIHACFLWNALNEIIQAAKVGLRVCWPRLWLISAVRGFWTTTSEDSRVLKIGLFLEGIFGKLSTVTRGALVSPLSGW